MIHGAVCEPREVAVLYVEGAAADVESAIAAARALGLTVALTAPDSMLAVVSRDRLDIIALRARISGFSADTRVAIGISRAMVSGDGNLGRSFVFNEPALRLIAQRMPATMELAVTAVRCR